MYSFAYTKEVIASIHQLPSFKEFASELESRPHGAVHTAIGGDMMPSTSPNDPIFFMHHAQVDRLWALWQQEDPEVREKDYSGFKTQNKYDGSVRLEASLTDIMNFSGLSKDLTVEQVMSTKSNILCYKY
jgi:tyrosinase